MDVHLVEHLGPVLGLETPLARVHRQDGIALVELPGEPGLDLQLIKQGGQLGGSLGGLLGEGPVVAGQLAGGRGIVGQGTGPLVVGDGGPQARGPLAHGLGRRRVVPEVRCRRLLVEGGQIGGLLIDMQEGPRIGQAPPRPFQFLLYVLQFHTLPCVSLKLSGSGTARYLDSLRQSSLCETAHRAVSIAAELARSSHPPFPLRSTLAEQARAG